MHQSLEGDEVLNVRYVPSLSSPLPSSQLTRFPSLCRWATEDPNPTAKRSELVRLKEQGEAGIANALDPEFVQRVRELDELEGILPPREEGEGAEEGEEEEGQGREKRARIEPPREEQEQEQQPPLPNEAPPPPQAVAPAKSGILSGDALGSLQFMASLKARGNGNGGGGPVKVAVEQPKKPMGLGGLAAYGSDDDSD